MRRAIRTTIVATSLSCLAALVLAGSPANAAVTLTVANGVTNPPPSLGSTALTPQQFAIADTAALVAVGDFKGVLQKLLDLQGFTAANNWALDTTSATLGANATFNVTAYNLHLNPGGDDQGGIADGTPAGSAFGELMKMTLNPNLAQPGGLPVGSTATLHWLQYINTDHKPGGTFGFNIPGQTGFYEFDNGFKNGAAASGATKGPYYDSNAGGGTFSTPPDFEDDPKYFAGVGTFLHFTTIPAWDIFTPAGGGNPATESIDVGNYGVTWGFAVVPEPATGALLVLLTFAVGKRPR